MALTEKTVQTELLVDFSKLCPEYDPYELIGRRQYLDIALSAANPADTRIGSRYNRLNPAYLFTGRTGSGRHTLEMSTGLMLLDMVTKLGEPESNFRWYLLPDGALDGDSSDEICQNINVLFDAVEEDMKNDDYFVQLSLGRLEPVRRKKRAARLLAKRLRTVIGSQQSCLVTAVFGSDASVLPDEIRTQFLALEMTDPDTEQRAAYLAEANSMHPQILWEMPIEKMAEHTEGFTFGMLKNTVNLIFSLATGMIISDGGNVEDYLFITDSAPLSVPEESIAFIIDNVSGTRRELARQPEVPLSPVQYLLQSLPSVLPQEKQPEPEPEAEPDTEFESHKPDTPSEMERIFETLTMPVTLIH